jgi:hypothetical protein
VKGVARKNLSFDSFKLRVSSEVGKWSFHLIEREIRLQLRFEKAEQFSEETQFRRRFMMISTKTLNKIFKREFQL